jgi:hypothetical protein
MRALVVYESMYGNTHHIAEAVAEGLGDPGTVDVVPVARADAPLIKAADLIVVGGPTHVHGMSRPATRHSAVEASEKPESHLSPEPDADGPGLREWLDGLDGTGKRAAAFDTRLHMAGAITGRASKGISGRLRACGFEEIVKPTSFFVTKTTVLEPGEDERARAWGRRLAAALHVTT